MSTHNTLPEERYRSDRPPTYASRSGESDNASVVDHSARVRSWRGSMLSNPPLLILDGQNSPQGSGRDSNSLPSSPLAREIYYRVYSPYGAIESKHSFYPHDKSLGRINARWVAPPQNAASIKRHLCKEEQIDDRIPINLFTSMSSAYPMDDEALVSITNSDGPGSTPEEPLALVITLEPSVETPGANVTPPVRKHSRFIPAWLLFRNHDNCLKVKKPKSPQEPSSPPTMSQPEIPILFNKKIKAKFDIQNTDPNWLSHTKGEILYTDGIQRYSGPWDQMRVLLAQNGSGKVGYVYTDDMNVS